MRRQPRWGTSFLAAALACTVVLAWTAAAAPPVPYLVADIEKGSFGSDGSQPGSFRELGERTLFFTGRSFDPVGLGVTDGTAVGTRALAALCTGGYCEEPEWLWVGEERALLFVADRSAPEHGAVWTTDGTAAGTRLLLTTDGHRFGHPRPAAVLGGFGDAGPLLLQVRDRTGTTAVWRSDATAEGTWPLALSAPLDERVLPVPAARLGGDRLVFVLETAEHGAEPWITDGTPAGTRLLLDLVPGAGGSAAAELTDVGGRVVFTAYVGTGGRELWTSDGSAAGTRPLTDSPRSVSILAAAGDRVLFADGLASLWATDGTAEGTVEIAAGGRSSASAFEVVGELVFFHAYGEPGTFETQLWVSDGTAAGTRPLTDLEPGSRVVFQPFLLDLGSYQPYFLPSGGRVYFQAWQEGFGLEPWVSDGTPAGTHRVADLCSGACDHRITDFEPVPEGLAFQLESFQDGEEREQIWITDGTSAGTRRLAAADRELDLGPWVGGDLFFAGSPSGAGDGVWATDGAAAPHRVAAVDGVGAWGTLSGAAGELLLFAAAAPQRGVEPWISDGTAAGTGWLADLELGGGRSSHPQAFTAYRDDLYFHVGGGLWRTDGRPEGTERLFDAAWSQRVGEVLYAATHTGALLRVDPVSQQGVPLLPDRTLTVEGLGALGGRAVFFARRPSSPQEELWITDGTAAGTAMLHADLVSAGFGRDGGVVSIDGPAVLFFAFHDGTTALWRSDGTPQGTARVSPLDLVGSVSPPELRPLAGGALLVGVPPSEIWYSDGTAAGTRRLAQPQGRSTSEHAEVDGIAYFTASRSGSGGDLWRSDGTVAGTYRVLAAAEAGWLAGPSELLAFDGLVVFAAEDAELGSELWLSDGTPGGTRPLADLHPGPGGSRPSELTAVGDRLFFSADDAIHGREPWVTDGTVGGSRRVGDVAAGPASSRPEELTAAGGLLYFRATDGVHGVEPWALPLAVDVGPCVAGESTLCLGAGGRFGVAVEWHDQHNGGSGVGRAVPVAGSEKTGAFWFFGPSNLELLVKVLDGAGVNGYHWVFWGGLSDVEYTLGVTDHDTGFVRRYRNPPGRICGGADTTAFAAAGGTGAAADTGAASRAAAPAAGEPLLLAGERFRVEVDWRNQRTGVIGTGLARPVTDNTGFFSFFDSANVELVVKVLDGRPVNGRFWVFYGALTDVEYTILVTDTASGGEVSYHNPPGEICGEADTAAF